MIHQAIDRKAFVKIYKLIKKYRKISTIKKASYIGLQKSKMEKI